MISFGSILCLLKNLFIFIFIFFFFCYWKYYSNLWYRTVLSLSSIFNNSWIEMALKIGQFGGTFIWHLFLSCIFSVEVSLSKFFLHDSGGIKSPIQRLWINNLLKYQTKQQRFFFLLIFLSLTFLAKIYCL